MRRTVVLEAFKDESTGEIGLGVVGMPRDETINAVTDGLGIAHDLLEHVNGPEHIGTIDDELEALGALWYVRGQHGQLRRDGVGSFYSIEENIASDVTRMFRDHIDGGAHINFNLPRTRPCDADEALDTVLDCSAEQYLSEISDEAKDEAVKVWPQYRALCLARMRTGFRKVSRKWACKGRLAANHQFWAIAEAVSPYARRPEFEGQQFQLTYGGGAASCEEIYE